MEASKFWELISLTDKELLEECDEDGAFEPVIDALSTLSEDEIFSFDEHMTRALYEIDGQKWLEEAGDSTSDDSFLYARCYVVAQGENKYNNVKGNPSLMPKSLDQWAETLLYVPIQAWANATGKDEEEYENETTVSYETCSNEKLWDH